MNGRLWYPGRRTYRRFPDPEDRRQYDHYCADVSSRVGIEATGTSGEEENARPDYSGNDESEEVDSSEEYNSSEENESSLDSILDAESSPGSDPSSDWGFAPDDTSELTLHGGSFVASEEEDSDDSRSMSSLAEAEPQAESPFEDREGVLVPA